MRSTEARLRRVFTEILAPLVATTAFVGCGGGVEGDPANPKNPTTSGQWTSLCDPRRSDLDLVDGLTSTPPLDGVVQRSESAFIYQDGQANDPWVDTNGDGWSAHNGKGSGTLCATATDRSACEAKVAGYRVLPATREACVAAYSNTGLYEGGESPRICAVGYLLYTRGDAIGVARTEEEIGNLIGTFDTVQEALWATSRKSKGEPRCGLDYPDAAFRQNADGSWETQLIEAENCENTSYRLTLRVDYAGNVTEVSREDLKKDPGCMMAGRRPAGLASCRSNDRDVAGAYFAGMATLEAASVTAFRRLQRQLKALGAPAELLARVRRAAKDEIRHARSVTALARKHGGSPRAPEIADDDREVTALSVALENAHEGCVRETFGALVAHYGKARASHEDVRRTMFAIADEETEHAALSWDIAAWLDAMLTEEERARVAEERAHAFEGLERELAEAPDPHLARVAGLPSVEEARAMLAGMRPILLAA